MLTSQTKYEEHQEYYHQEAQTEVLVADGDTTVIGGVFSSEHCRFKGYGALSSQDTQFRNGIPK